MTTGTALARRLGVLAGLLFSGCVTSVTSVQRSMVAPLPPAPLLNLDDTHGAQLGATGQLRLLNVQPTQTTSGIGVPGSQFTAGPMVRVSKQFAFGGALQLIPGSGTQFANSTGSTIGGHRDGYGLLLAGHFSTFDVKGFGIDGAIQASLHGLPVSINRGPGPLSTTAGSIISEVTTLIPGLALTVVPRYSTRYGTIFVGGQLHTNADIEARGVRVNTGARVVDDSGSVRAVLGQVGLGYSVTFGPGVGLSAQLWLPLGAQRFGYGPSLSVGAHVAFGQPPNARTPSLPVPPAPPVEHFQGPPPPPLPDAPGQPLPPPPLPAL